MQTKLTRDLKLDRASLEAATSKNILIVVGGLYYQVHTELEEIASSCVNILTILAPNNSESNTDGAAIEITVDNATVTIPIIDVYSNFNTIVLNAPYYISNTTINVDFIFVNELDNYVINITATDNSIKDSVDFTLKIIKTVPNGTADLLPITDHIRLYDVNNNPYISTKLCIVENNTGPGGLP
jgi:hypothetical protein